MNASRSPPSPASSAPRLAPGLMGPSCSGRARMKPSRSASGPAWSLPSAPGLMGPSRYAPGVGSGQFQAPALRQGPEPPPLVERSSDTAPRPLPSSTGSFIEPMRINGIEVVKCPLDESHFLKASRLQYHIVKCLKNYKGDKVNCPYNATEMVEPRHLPDHLKVCRGRIAEYAHFSGRVRKPPLEQTTPNFHNDKPWQTTTSDDDSDW